MSRLVPLPQEIQFCEGDDYVLCNQCKVVIDTADNSLDVKKFFRDFWDVTPAVEKTATSAVEAMGAEEYAIRIDAATLTISAKTAAGLRFALMTLRQLAEPQRGTAQVAAYILPECTIKDAPALPFRGIHLCIFPETKLWDIERMIRLAAYHKVNYVVVETWGVFPFESHPEFCWTDRQIDKGELKRLIHLGKELGVTLFPQFNLLGHATSSRVIAGKHAVLDYHKSLQPLFEPCGWSWCLSNPETRRVLTDLVQELYDFYERPPFFHIGCDEAYDLGSCAECGKRELKELVLDHILYFRNLLRQQGARVIMWHDMLLSTQDERWKGYIVCGDPEHHLEELYKELPKDIVIADWQYGYNVKNSDPEPTWPTSKFFKSENFDVLVCPWQNERVAVSLGAMAEEEKLTGLLETTWHIYHNDFLCNNFTTALAAAWSPSQERKYHFGRGRWLATALHLRQIGWDMGINEYHKTGFVQEQVDPGERPFEIL